MPRCLHTFRTLLLVLVISAVAHAGDQLPFAQRLSNAALTLTKDNITYDPTYYRIPYPGGDVPAGKGVCTDVVIRAFRQLGIDLQKLVHEDMLAARSAYPNTWGKGKVDANIDHRRVPNLMAFFARHGRSLAKSTNAADYRPGDIVSWRLDNGLTHIGLCVAAPIGMDRKPWIVHNIGGGQVLENCLFDWQIIGHYRYPGK